MLDEAAGAIAEVPTSAYREHPPPAALAAHVLCLWSQVIGAGEVVYRHRVLPDGCTDIVWIGETPAVVAGPARGAIVVPLRPRTIVVGVRLRPGAASSALGLPASELADRDTPCVSSGAPGPTRLRHRSSSNLRSRPGWARPQRRWPGAFQTPARSTP